MDDVAQSQEIEDRLPTVPTALPQGDLDEEFEERQPVLQKQTQREQDLMVAMTS